MSEPELPSIKRRVTKKDVLGVTLGAGLEFFDFSAYAIFALLIGQAFFPGDSAFMSLLMSVVVFGVGFVARPLGAVVLGIYADKAGRKPAMLITMLLMVIGTGGLAVLPDYSMIGLAAPILLVLLRILQGIAWGGEAGPATTFIMEAAPPGKRGLYTSWQIVSQGAAGICAGLIGYVLSVLLTEQQLASWGWRVPFLFGLLVLPLALYLRRHLQDTFDGADSAAAQASNESLLKKVFTQQPKLIVIGILMISGSTITQYFLNYMATYALHDLHYPQKVAMASPVIIGIGVMIFSLLGGWLADRIGRRTTIILPRLLLVVILLPGLMLIDSVRQPMVFFLVISLFTVLQCISGAGVVVALCENFPRHLRASGFSIAYTFGITLFGGTAQVVFSSLTEATDNPVAPGYYLLATNILCILAALFISEVPRQLQHAPTSHGNNETALD